MTTITDTVATARGPVGPATAHRSGHTTGSDGTARAPGERLIRPRSKSAHSCPARRSSRAATVIVGGGPVERYRRAHRPVHDRRCGVPPRRPNYAIRRCAAVLVAVVVVAAGWAAVTTVAASFGGAPASAAEVSPSDEPSIGARHVARPGDTLWSIAAVYRGEIPHDRYLDAVIRLNGGTRIEVGQAVRLP